MRDLHSALSGVPAPEPSARSRNLIKKIKRKRIFVVLRCRPIPIFYKSHTFIFINSCSNIGKCFITALRGKKIRVALEIRLYAMV